VIAIVLNTVWNYFSTAQRYLDRPIAAGTLGMSIPSFSAILFVWLFFVLQKYTHLNMTGVCMR
jgi:hypothetical protein